MKGPESSGSVEVLKEDAWKVLQRDTGENGVVFALITARGIVRSDTIEKILEYVRDEVTRGIAESVIAPESFCGGEHFRRTIYENKIVDFFRSDRQPFMEADEIGGGGIDAPAGNFLTRLEAVDELSKALPAIKNERQRRRLETILGGAVLGLTNNEIADELGRIEGTRVTESRITQLYGKFRKAHLQKRFPDMPATLSEFRSRIEPRNREVAEERVKQVQEYSVLLSKELERLKSEVQTALTRQEILVIEYLLGAQSFGSLAVEGLFTSRHICVVRERIASRLGIPFQDLKQNVLLKNKPKEKSKE